MANELHTSFNGTATIYATIRAQTTGYVWNGTALVAWVDGNVATYAISLSSFGGDLYAADMPSGVPSGAYFINYYQQLDVDPAITDTLLNSESFDWDGNSNIIPPAPGAADLTTLAIVKQYMGIASGDVTYDAQLAFLITAASDAVTTWCDRIFQEQQYTEYVNGLDSWRCGYMSPRNYPVTVISRIAVRPVVVLFVSNTDTTNNQRAEVSVLLTGLKLFRTSNGNVISPVTLLFATYTTIGALAAAINAVGNGWTATVCGGPYASDYAGWATADLRVIQGSLNARFSASAQLELYTDELPAMRIDTTGTDAPSTIYGKFPRGVISVELRYTAGYSVIPDAVIRGTTIVVKSLFDRSSKDSAVKSEKIGDYSYTLATPSGSEDSYDMSIPPDARILLQPFRRMRIL